MFFHFLSSYGSDLDTDWASVNKAMVNMGVENILLLIDLVLSMPPTTVFNERGFNQLKMCKHEKRQLLSQKRTNSCMQVRINGPTVEEFNPDVAISKWHVSTPINYSERAFQMVLFKN